MANIHTSFRINGLSAFDFLDQLYHDVRLVAFQKEIRIFKASKEFVFQTSGTTGKPKIVRFSKDQIESSAKATHNTFKLAEGDEIVNALPIEYVAGKMMLFRSMICGYSMRILNPDFNEKQFEKLNIPIQFIPLVPIQLERMLSFEVSPFNSIQKILIGGASVSENLKQRLLSLSASTKFYESFGSTETLTHIAINEILDSDTDFKAIEGVQFSEQNNLLVIHAPHIQNEPIVTNDIVELTSIITFKWKGRADNVINSGGIKIFPEQLESKLYALINSPFFIASEPSEKLGQQVILVVESESSFEIDLNKISLSKYEIPKKIYFIPNFQRTESGKTLRQKTLDCI